MTRAVLIIDDIENVVIRITEFLKKLGYSNITHANTSDKAIELFKELGKNNEHPIVFLDYDISDADGLSLLSRLLKLDVDGEIVIMSSLGRESENIRKLIDEGAYEVIQKPIRFDMIKSLMTIIETENNEKQDSESLVTDYLNTTNRLSELWLQENTNLESSELKKVLDTLISKNVISQVDDIQDVCCPSCGSIKTGHIFSCPECKKSSFVQSDLIEHYDCGTIDLEKNFENDTCPNCKKSLEAFGVDYKVLKNNYFCTKCQAKFQEPRCDYLCFKCKLNFHEDEIDWKSSRGFQLNS